MFDDTINYINTNPIPFVIITIILFLVLYKIYDIYNLNIYNSESFTNIPSTSDSTDPNDILIGQGTQLVRFKYTDPNGKKYYLSVEPITNCSNINSSSATPDETECITNVLILIDEDTMNKQINDYLSVMSDNQKICNFKKTLAQNKINNSETCYATFPECNLTKQHSVDFIVSRKKNGTMTKYVISGVNGRYNADNNVTKIFVNKKPSQNNVCADSSKYSDIFIETDLMTTKVLSQGNIIGGLDTNLRTIIRFKIIESHPTKGVIDTPLYVGKCTNKTCKTANGEYTRLCLYDDIINPNIINFEPVIQTY
jgi:hypothetical protein